jgi:hypothetical protein
MSSGASSSVRNHGPAIWCAERIDDARYRCDIITAIYQTVAQIRTAVVASDRFHNFVADARTLR